MPTTAKHDLDYFLANPDKIPDDMRALDALMVGGDLPEGFTEQDDKRVVGDPSGQGKTGEEKGKVEDDAANKGDGVANGAAATEDNTTKPDETPAGVLTKDEKHVLPYAVLRDERERRQMAERQVLEMRDRLERLEKSSAKGAEQQPDEMAQISDDLKAIEEDFPALGKLIGSLVSRIDAIAPKAEKAAAKVEDDEALRAQEAQDQVTAAVDTAIVATPALAFWREEKPRMFEVAIAYDNEVKADPKFSGLTLEQRFAKVAELVQADYGTSEVPAKYLPAKKEVEPDPKSLQEKAKEAVKNAGSFTPKTLSDIPGGTPPVEEAKSLENASVTDLEKRMATMTPDQISALLAKMG